MAVVRSEGNRYSLNCLLVLWIFERFRHTTSSLFSVSANVGQMAALPCNWTSYMDMPLPVDAPHLQWQTPEETIFELKGQILFQGSEYKGRVYVNQGRLKEGDCSLFLRQARLSDTGLYESFIVVTHRRRKFLRSVQLRVRGYKSRQSLGVGRDLALDLYTSDAAKVVFNDHQGAEDTVKWQRGHGGRNEGRIKEEEAVVILRGLNFSDAGTYMVLDDEGLVISTVHLTVEEVPAVDIKKDAVGIDGEDCSRGNRAAASAHWIMGALLFAFFFI